MKRRGLFGLGAGAVAVAALPVAAVEAPKRVITLDRSGAKANPMPDFHFRKINDAVLTSKGSVLRDLEWIEVIV